MFRYFIFCILSSFSLMLHASKSHVDSSGLLFNVSSSSGPSYQISLCLNGKGKVSCQNYNVKGYSLTINTVIPKHVYPIAGIKILNGTLKIPTTSPMQCTPNANGYCLFSVSDSSSKTIKLVTTSNLVILPTTISTAQVGKTYYQPFYLTGSYSPITWSLNSIFSTITNNFTLDSSTGVLTSNNDLSAVNPGIYPFTITAVDSQVPPVTVESSYNLYINGGLNLNPTEPFLGTYSVGNSIPTQFIVRNYSNTVTYTYSCRNITDTGPCELPSGISFQNSTNTASQNIGIFSGSISSSAVFKTYSFMIKVSDNASPTNTGFALYSLSLAGNLQIGPSSLTPATIDTDYSNAFYLNNPDSAVAPVSIINDSSTPIPSGLTLSSTSSTSPYQTPLQGQPLDIGYYNVIMNATDSNSNKGSHSYYLISKGDIDFDPDGSESPYYTLPSGTINQSYSGTTITATNVDASAEITWTVDGLPKGMTVTPALPATGSSSITINGTPTEAGVFTLKVAAYSSNATSKGLGVYSLTIKGNVTLSPSSGTFTGYINSTFSTQTIVCTPSGSDTSCTFNIQSGTCPTGLTCAQTPSTNNFVISGTPTATGLTTLQLQATSATAAAPTVGNYNINISSNIQFNPNTTTKCVAYLNTLNLNVKVSGFTAPLTSCKLTGAIPPNTNYSCNTASGNIYIYLTNYYFVYNTTYKFAITVTDTSGVSATSGTFTVTYNTYCF